MELLFIPTTELSFIFKWVLLLVSLVAVYAFYKNIRGLYLPLIVAFGLCLRLCIVSLEPDLQPWDERYHALVAKNIAAQPLKPTLYETAVLNYNYKEWYANHIWLHKPILTFWVLGLSVDLFGANIWALRLPSIVFSTLMIMLLYKIGERLGGRQVALWAAFLAAINLAYVELPSGRIATDHVDMLFVFLTALLFYFSIKQDTSRRNLFTIGMLLGLAMLTKWIVALFFLPAVLMLYFPNFLKERHRRFTYLASFFLLPLILGASWNVFCSIRYPLEYQYESSYNFRHVAEVLEGHRRVWYYHILKIGEMTTWLSLPAMVFFFTVMRKKYAVSLPVAFSLAVTPFIFLLVFSISATRMAMYTAPVFFFFLLFNGFALREIQNLAGTGMHRKIISLTVMGILVLYTTQRTNIAKKPTPPNQELSKEVAYLREHYPNPEGLKTIVFNSEAPIELMFLTDVTAYSSVPDRGILDSLNQLYEVILVNHQDDQLLEWSGMEAYEIADLR